MKNRHLLLAALWVSAMGCGGSVVTGTEGDAAVPNDLPVTTDVAATTIGASAENRPAFTTPKPQIVRRNSTLFKMFAENPAPNTNEAMFSALNDRSRN